MNDNINQKPKGTGFVNLQQYLNANKDNKLAGTIGQGIQSTVDTAKQGLNEADQNFQQDANSKLLSTDENTAARSGILNRATSGNVLTDEEKNKFTSLREGSYGGPEGLTDIGKLQNQAEDAEGLGKAMNTQGGRFGLLQRYLGKPQYSSGEQRFDELLLGQGDKTALNSARRSTYGLKDAVSNRGNAATEVAKTIANKNKSFGAETQGQLEGANQSIYNPLNARVDAEKSRIQGDINTVKGNENISPELAEKLGLPLGTKIYNLDLGNYFSNVQDPNAAGMASAQERAAASALATLGGQGAKPTIDVNAAAYDPANAYKFDANRAKQDAYTRGKSLDSEVKETSGGRIADPQDAINAEFRQIIWPQFNQNPNDPARVQLVLNDPGNPGMHSIKNFITWAENRILDPNSAGSRINSREQLTPMLAQAKALQAKAESQQQEKLGGMYKFNRTFSNK